MKKKLTCHCGGFEAEVNIPEKGIEKVMRCNCTLCKRKGYVIGVLGENDFKIISVARFSDQKDHFCLIRSINLLKKKYENIKVLLIGSGEKEISWIIELLDSKDRTKAGKQFPPEGLFLIDIEYDAKYNLSYESKPPIIFE